MATRRRPLEFVVSTDTRQFKRGMHSLGPEAQRAGRSVERGIGTGFRGAERHASRFQGVAQRTGRVAGAAWRGVGIAASAGAVAAGFGVMKLARAAVDYEKQMSRVKAVTGASSKEMAGLNALAKKMGAETKFSAGDAADAMYELASAGFKTNEMGKTLRGTLAVAAASNIDLASASEITANALRGFGLGSDKAGHVADVLAKAVNASSVEMVDLQYSMKYIGPIARTTGQDFETMTAALELMGNAGIKGEQAGTTLRGALVRLTRPTKMVEKGLDTLGLSAAQLHGPKGLKPLPEIIKLIEGNTKGMDKATRNAALAQIFGTEALTGMVAVVDQGSGKLVKLTEANRHSEGQARKTAKVMQDNLSGSLENLGGSFETAGISIYEKFQKPLKDLVDDSIPEVNKAGKELSGFLDTILNDPKFKKGDLSDKLSVVTDKTSDALAHGLEEAFPKVAEGSVKLGGKIAVGLGKGFLDSDAWTKLAIGGFLIAKFGGWKAVAAVGRLTGRTWGLSFSRGAAETTVMPVPRGGPGRGPGGGPVPVPVPGRGRGGSGGGRGRGGGLDNPQSPNYGTYGPRGPQSPRNRRRDRLRRRLPRAPGVPRPARGVGGRAVGAGFTGLFLGAGADAASQALGQGNTLPYGRGFSGLKFAGQQATSTVSDVFSLRWGHAAKQITKDVKPLQQFGKGADDTAKKLAKINDNKGLRDLSARARKLAKEWPEVAGGLNKFADRSDKAADAASKTTKRVEKAMREMSRGSSKSVKDLEKNVDTGMSVIRKNFGSDSQKAKDLMGRNIGAAVKNLGNSMKKGTISTKQGMAEIRRLTKRDTGASKEIISSNFKAAATVIREQMRRGAVGTREGTREINRLLTASLAQYGFTAKQAGFVLAGRRFDGGGNVHADLTNKARGGVVQFGRAGDRGMDTIPVQFGEQKVMVGSGELGVVLTGEQQAELDARTADVGGLGGFFSEFNRQHYLGRARGGFVRKLARGGAIPRHGGVAALVALGRQLRGEGFQVGENRALGDPPAPGSHAAGGYHYKYGGSGAMDVNHDQGGEGAALDALARRLTAAGWHYLWRVAGHFDHLHVDVAGGGGGAIPGGAAAVKLKRVMMRKGLGAITTMGQKGLDRLRKAAEDKVNAAVGAGGESGGVGAGFKGPWTQVMADIAASKGWNLGDWKQLVQGESGGNPAARNPSSGAFGLGQFLGGTLRAYAKYGATSHDGSDQIRAMAQYISDRYGNPTNAYNTWKSRSPHWYGRGGFVSGARVRGRRGFQTGGVAASRAKRRAASSHHYNPFSGTYENMTSSQYQALKSRWFKKHPRTPMPTRPKKGAGKKKSAEAVIKRGRKKPGKGSWRPWDLDLAGHPISWVKAGTVSEDTYLRHLDTEQNQIGERAAGRVEDIDADSGLQERTFDLTEEDLGTPEGREARAGELTTIGGFLDRREAEQVRTSKSWTTRIHAIDRRIRQLKKPGDDEQQLARQIRGTKDPKKRKALQAKLAKAKAKRVKRVRTLRGRRGEDIESRADVRRELRGTRLDEQANEQEIDKLRHPPANDAVAEATEMIELKRAAGELSDTDAAKQTAAVYDRALRGEFGQLTERERLEIKGKQREQQQAAIDALAENTAALKEMKDELKRNNDFADSVVAVTGREAVRALVDVFNGNLGPTIDRKSRTPGTGKVASF